MDFKKKIKQLIDFENKVANLFNNSKIYSPIHLYSNNEGKIIRIFEKINEKDWVFCSWRSHYQCLLKGVKKDRLLKEITKGKSISLCFPSKNVFSSAIVAGQIPIAIGVAWSIKIKKGKEKVYCFMGDMTSETGMANECIKYAKNFKLPITFIIEDNNLSVCTNTRKTWGIKKLSNKNNKKTIIYKYKNKYPHAGAGRRVEF